MRGTEGRYRRELLKGSTDALLLALLQERPMYGYLIIKELERRSRGYFRFNEGTLYPALHRLEKMGLIQGRWERSPNGQGRRYYHITEKGLRSLAEKKEEWKGFAAAVGLVTELGSS